MKTKTESRKILAEFHCQEDGALRLFGVWVVEPVTLHNGKPGYSRTGYDVEFSASFGYIYHSSSGGMLPKTIEGIYWASPGLSIPERATKLCSHNYQTEKLDAETRYIRARNRTRRLKQLPKEFRGAKHYDYSVTPTRVSPGDLMDWLEHNAIQQDAVYCSACEDSLPSEELCAHCWWCDSAGDYVTPGEGSACFDPDCFECRRVRLRKHEAHRDKRRRERWQARWAAERASVPTEAHP